VIKQCCACHKSLEAGVWVPHDGIAMKASHTYCPPCKKVVMDEIKNMAVNRGRLVTGLLTPGSAPTS